MNSTILDETQTAQKLGLSIKTLQSWRWRKIGPRYLKIGGAVRYAAEDIEEYLKSRAVETRDSSRGD